MSKISVHKCVVLFMGLQFYSIDQHICLCTNTMQFLSLFLCSKAWGQGDSPSCSFIVTNWFCYSIFFFFLPSQMNLRIVLPISLKNFVGVLIGITLNLYIAFGKMAVFTMIILPIQEHGRSLHFLRSSLISFLRDLKLLSCRFLICSDRI